MRILFVNHTSRVSGAERSLLELMRRASANSTVILACPDGELLLRAKDAGIQTVPLAFPQFGFAMSFRSSSKAAVRVIKAGLELRRLARQLDVDVIHAGAVRSGLTLACCLFSKPERTVDVRDVLPRRATAFLVRCAIRLSADTIVFNSRFTRDRFGATAPARSAVAYPPIDLTPFLDLPLAADRRRGAPTLGIIGQITPWKGQDDAVRILAALRGRIPGLTLRVVGSPVFEGDAVSFDNAGFDRQLRALALDLGVADAVEFTGESEDVRAEFAKLDCLLVPSWTEPFGRVVAEGMAAGVPVVATSVGGPAELITNGMTGFLAPPRRVAEWVDPVAAVIEDQGLSHQIAEQARKRVKELLGVEAEVSKLPRTRRGEGGQQRPRGRRVSDEMNIVLVSPPILAGDRRRRKLLAGHRARTRAEARSHRARPPHRQWTDRTTHRQPLSTAELRAVLGRCGADRAHSRVQCPTSGHGPARGAGYSRCAKVRLRPDEAPDRGVVFSGACSRDLTPRSGAEPGPHVGRAISSRQPRCSLRGTPRARSDHTVCSPQPVRNRPGRCVRLPQADRIVALLDADADVYEGLGIRRDRIEVCGVCSPASRPVMARDPPRFHIKGPLVVFLGVGDRTRASTCCSSAAPLVATAVQDVTFAFVGPGETVPGIDGVRVVDAGFAPRSTGAAGSKPQTWSAYRQTPRSFR